jgi:hypothetical protein
MTSDLLEKKLHMDSLQEHPCPASGRRSRFKGSKVLLPANFTPSPDSILCGRGKAASAAQGNRRLKMIVTQSLQQYSEARSKLDKSATVSRIVNMVKQAAPEGAFVKFEQGHWWQVEDGVAREKVGRIFRDCLPTQYRSSTKFKLARRRGRNAMKDDLNCSSNRSHNFFSHMPQVLLQVPQVPTTSIRLPSASKDIMQKYANLQANYARGRVTSSNKFCDDIPMSAHHAIVGDSAILVGEDNNIFRALDQACDLMRLRENQFNTLSFPNNASSVFEACDITGLEDSADLPDDISGIFSDETFNDEDEDGDF